MARTGDKGLSKAPTIVDQLLRASTDIDKLDADDKAALLERAADHLEDLCSSAGQHLPDSTRSNVKGLRRTARFAPALTPEQLAETMRTTAQIITATEMLASSKTYR